MNQKPQILIFFVLLVVFSCKKEEKSIIIPIVKTLSSTDIDKDNDSATFNGLIENEGDSKITERGFYYGQVPDRNRTTTNVVGITNFYAKASYLTHGDYYIQAFAKNKAGIGYGEVITINMYKK